MTADEVLIRLWPDARSCSHARQVVRNFCFSRGLADVAYEAELLTSEVVTNAVRHSDGMLTILIVRANESLAVTVSDNNAEVPNLPVVTPNVLADGGRGLLVLDALAGDWGIAPGPSGKTVWFRLP